MVEPAHSHEAKEHVYYIIKGRGKVQLGDQVDAVADGDAVYLPAQGTHSIVNDSDEFIDLPGYQRHPPLGSRRRRRRLLRSGSVDPVIRNWRDDAHRESHGAVGWSVLAEKASFRTVPTNRHRSKAFTA